jgi:hypothetical protein
MYFTNRTPAYIHWRVDFWVGKEEVGKGRGLFIGLSYYLHGEQATTFQYYLLYSIVIFAYTGLKVLSRTITNPII